MSKNHLKCCGNGTSPVFWVYLNLYGDKLDSFHCQLFFFISLNAHNTPTISHAFRVTH